MKMNVLKNEIQNEPTLFFSENLFFLEEFFCVVRCHYKSFPSNTLCFWHVINVNINLPKVTTPLHTKNNIYGVNEQN
jgi:hypothetical protein